jgi:hypothetical protein
MRWVLNKHMVCVVLAAFAIQVFPVRALAGESFVPGTKSSDEAASPQSFRDSSDGSFESLRYAIPATGGFAEPDSSGFEFPDDENKHLVRDITVFLIASAFVAVFLIKVFLEEDKEDDGGDDGGSGKPPPPI